MSSEVAISVRNLSKVYRIYDKPEHRLVQMATLGRIRRFKEFSALHDISLEVRRGETVGIIGRNGCGKSTLLQMICGTLQPSQGSVEVHGRIAALLELGAGFSGEFTGRENVYMNGAILGFSREEMDARFEQIAQFAGIGDFIERPVKTYSSGMYVRLAFAVATAVEPDILVVDEALAVGDEAFQRKCYARIEAIKERGGTILFVSHGAQTIVQLCDRAVLLDAGEKLLEGEPKTVVGHYQRLINLDGQEAAQVRDAIRRAAADPLAAEATEKTPLDRDAAPSNEALDRSRHADHSWFDPGLSSSSTIEYDSHGARISNVRIEAHGGRAVNVLQLGQNYTVAYDVRFDAAASHVIFGFQAKTVSGLPLAGANNKDLSERKRAGQGETYTARFEFHCSFMPGTFVIDVGVMTFQDDEHRFLHRIVDALMFRVAPERGLADQGLISLNTRFSAELTPENTLDTGGSTRILSRTPTA